MKVSIVHGDLKTVCGNCRYGAWDTCAADCPIRHAITAVEVRRGGGVTMEYIKRPRSRKEPIFQWNGRPVRLYATEVK